MRRCPTSVSRALSTAAIAQRTVQFSVSQSLVASRRIAPLASKVFVASLHQSAVWRQVAVAEQASTGEATQQEQEPIRNFKDLATKGLVHPNIVNTITKHMKLETMTDVQTATINEALSGVDM